MISQGSRGFFTMPVALESRVFALVPIIKLPVLLRSILEYLVFLFLETGPSHVRWLKGPNLL